MGADIHLVVEQKFGDKWIGIDTCRSFQLYKYNRDHKAYDKPEYVFHNAASRNYTLFAALAGVRGEGPEPKGLPEDASELALAMLSPDDPDLHSHSWCTIGEYIQHLLASADRPAEIFLAGERPEVKDPYGFYFRMYAPEEHEEYRVVFAFDN